MVEYMTGKEIINLIRKLREKGMNSDETKALEQQKRWKLRQTWY